MHAWSGQNRIPLQGWQMRPYVFCDEAVRTAAGAGESAQLGRSLVKPPASPPEPSARRHAEAWPLGPQLKRIAAETAKKHRLPVEVIIGTRGDRAAVHARFEVYHRAITETRLSTTQIGLRLGGRDHTTVISGAKRYPQLQVQRSAP